MTDLRELNFISIALRLLLAMFFGGLIGIERGKKHRAAGFRTYMLVSMGAALTMMLGQYEYMVDLALNPDLFEHTDVSRFGAQVISGIGFLGAGTILITAKQAVRGITTAAGLWASGCMGLAIGAGFYEGMVLAFVLILLSIRFLPFVENLMVENSLYMNVFVEFDEVQQLGTLLSALKAMQAQIYDVELTRDGEGCQHPSALFSFRLSQRVAHTEVLSRLAAEPCVLRLEEV